MITTNISPLTAYLHNNSFTVLVEQLSADGVIKWGDSNITIITEDGEYTHTYDSYGQYNINIESCEFLANQIVAVYPLYYQNIQILNSVPDMTAGCSLEIIFSAFSFDQINTFSLYASGSNSGKYENPPSFWSHLNPQWSFTDSDGNVISTITLTGNPVYDESVLVGYELSTNIFYNDDLPGNPVIIITKE